MKVSKVVTSFLVKNGRILLLKRSGKVGSYRDRWSGVSGYIEDGPIEQAYKEIWEELSIPKESFQLLEAGNPEEVTDEKLDMKWMVYSFLFEFLGENYELKLDWENVEAKWVKIEEIEEMETVPGLCNILKKLWSKAF